jgi:hypothetical protein
MKNISLIITIGIIGFIVFKNPSSGSSSDQDKDVVVEIDASLPEVKKVVRFSIEDKQFKTAPQWSGSDFSNLPISMEKAVRVARRFLTDNGCTGKHYYLFDCSLNRLYRGEFSTQWYWKVSFGDDSFTASVDPIVTIPVLMDGKVPKYEMNPRANQ